MLKQVQEEKDQMKETMEGYKQAEAKHKKDMAALQTQYESNISKSQPHILRDDTTFFDRVRNIGLTLTPVDHQKYGKHQSDCNIKAEEAEFMPNNNQFGCAVFIAEHLKATAKENKILFTMPPGEGKSRITVALLYLMMKKNVTYFTLLFSHEAIMKADQDKLERLETQWGLDIRYEVYAADKEISARTNEMLIIDEADYLLLDKQLQPDKKFKYIVGLTATALEKKDGVE